MPAAGSPRNTSRRRWLAAGCALFAAGLVGEATADTDAQAEADAVIQRWLAALDDDAAVAVDDGWLAGDATLTLADTPPQESLAETVKRRRQVLTGGKYTVRQTQVTSSPEADATRYDILAVVDWQGTQDANRQELARLKLHIKARRTAGEAVIYFVSEKYMLPSDSLGATLKC